ncbi:MAG: tetratricopeptide repeat protein [Bacteroidota bacterium]
MKKLLLLIVLMVMVPKTTLAKRVKGLFGKSERIQKIIDVETKGPNGEALYLGYKTTSLFFFMGIYMKDDGYVLGVKESISSYYPVNEMQLASLQKSGDLPNKLPSYEIPLTDWLWGFSFWILLAVLGGIWFFPKSGRGLFEQGCNHYFGRNSKVDYFKALCFFQKSAKKKYGPAIFNLGIMHLKGQGITKDVKKSVALFEEASEKGNTNANVILGNLYYEGKEIAKDLDKAKMWFTKACDQGHDKACKMVTYLQQNK